MSQIDNVLKSSSTLKNIDPAKTIAYTFKELNGQELPSFALDVSYNKASNTNRLVVDDGGASMYSRIFTGCQVNTMTLNFEESQELKTSLELVTRRAFDAPTDYVPHRAEEGATGLFNYDASTTTPYMYSDGSITSADAEPKHPLMSVTVQEYVPADKLIAVAFICPFDHK